jgi:hypothetical protein
MANKYIDHLTLEEYSIIEKLLEKYKDLEETEMKETGSTKDYVALRFILIKIKRIKEKYTKK